MENLPKNHLRHVLLYEFNKGVNASQAASNICETYGASAIAIRTAQKWFSASKSFGAGLGSAVIGGERHLTSHLIPVPHSSKPIDQAIRVVKAFQAGTDRESSGLTGPSAARLREISRQLKLQVDAEGRAMSRSRSASRQQQQQNNEAISSV
uniref:Mos1 transposase HTH domain-containing protein n=1 Tax=Ditylenchus dipsaci TaxID=166011 RepID=A0A915D6J2_9BILA